MKPMRVYISGPITGTKDAGIRFADGVKKVLDVYPNAEIVNPVWLASTLPALRHDEYMLISFAALDACTHIFQLDKWQDSRGCNQELGYAYAKGIKVLEVDRNE